MMRALILLVSLLAAVAHAQVAGICAAGRACRVSTLRVGAGLPAWWEAGVGYGGVALPTMTVTSGQVTNRFALNIVGAGAGASGISMSGYADTGNLVIGNSSGGPFQFHTINRTLRMIVNANAYDVSTPSAFYMGAASLAGVELLRLDHSTGATGKIVSYRVGGTELSYIGADGRFCTAAGACTPSAANALLSGFLPPNTALALNTAFAAHRMMQAGTGARLTATTAVAGTGAGTLTLDVYDITKATSLCSKTIACNGAVGGINAANCSSAFAALDDVRFSLSADECATQPALNVVWEVTR